MLKTWSKLKFVSYFAIYSAGSKILHFSGVTNSTAVLTPRAFSLSLNGLKRQTTVTFPPEFAPYTITETILKGETKEMCRRQSYEEISSGAYGRILSLNHINFLIN